MKKAITGTIRLSKSCKRCKRMPLTIAGVTTATAGGNKNGAEAGFFSKFFIIKGNISRQKLPVLAISKSGYWSIQNILLCGSCWMHFCAGLHQCEGNNY